MRVALIKQFLPVLTFLLFSMGCATSPSDRTMEQVGTGISGSVLLRATNEPVSGAHVYAYRDYGKNLIGVADYVSKGSDKDGAYTLDLPPGEYYVVSRKRVSGANYGPVVTGDLYDHRFELEPVRITAGRYSERDFHLERLSEPMFFQFFTESQRRTDTGIKGRIIDQKGEPVQGAFATAYRDGNMKRMPDFVSTLSDDEGRFTLYLPEGGKWYIGARSHARGVPQTGEPVGSYEGSDDNSIQVTDQTFLDGVDITLRPFDSKPPPGYRPY